MVSPVAVTSAAADGSVLVFVAAIINSPPTVR
jgi:hypothetical protein